MTVAPFVPDDWRAAYPEFAAVTDQAAQGYFNTACLYLNNTDASRVPCDPVTYQPRQQLLYLLTAHVAELMKPNADGSGSLANPLVGRISNASEGSVSVATQFEADKDASWFIQTTYGALYWQATAQYRTAVYVPRPGGRGRFGGYYGRSW
jgi:hypothetical protein